MLFEGADPLLTLPLEQVHAVGADIGLLVELAAPDAEDVVVLVDEHLAVHGPELFRGVDVEDEDAAGIQDSVGPPDGGFAVSGVRDIVQAVQGADGHVHGSGEPQIPEVLAGEHGPVFHVHGLHHGLRQHFLGQVHAGDLIALPGQDLGHGAGAAGHIHHGAGRQALPLQDLLVEGHGGLVVNIVGQAVVAGRQIMISVHHGPPQKNARMRLMEI